MNFQYIVPIATAKSLLDTAFRRAREKSAEKKLHGDWIEKTKRRETMKVDVVKDVISIKLEKYLDCFPKEKELSDFYQRLIHLTMDYQLYKKSLAAMNWANKRLMGLQKQYAQQINKSLSVPKIHSFSKEYYGRISSILKQIDKNLLYLEECRQIFRSFPDVKARFTVCIYGFPNVGKSTLINKLTGSKAKVASYAFTTTTINSGFVTTDDKEVQFLDVPGALSRETKMNPIELIAELVCTEVANILIYVFDPSESCGYGMEKQEELYQKVAKDKPVLIYVSKTDLLADEVLKAFPHKYYSLEEIKAKVLKLAPKYVPEPEKEPESEISSESDTDPEVDTESDS